MTVNSKEFLNNLLKRSSFLNRKKGFGAVVSSLAAAAPYPLLSLRNSCLHKARCCDYHFGARRRWWRLRHHVRLLLPPRCHALQVVLVKQRRFLLSFCCLNQISLSLLPLSSRLAFRQFPPFLWWNEEFSVCVSYTENIL